MKSKTIHVITGTVYYIPKIVGYDKYDRHSITIIPDDSSIIDLLNQERSVLLDSTAALNKLDPSQTPVKAPWKALKQGDVTITFNWSDRAVADSHVVLFDDQDRRHLTTDEWPSDRQLRRAKIKISCIQDSYCFENPQGEVVFGVKLKARKIKIEEFASLSDWSVDGIDAEGVVKELVASDF